MISIGTFVYCILIAPMEINNKIVYQQIYGSCKVEVINETVTEGVPMYVYVNCRDDLKWIFKDQKWKPIYEFWSPYEKGACHVQKYHWE